MKRFVLFFIVLLVMVPVFASDAISLSDYLASSEYSWFLHQPMFTILLRM